MNKIKSTGLVFIFFVLLCEFFTGSAFCQTMTETEKLYRELIVNASSLEDDSLTVEKYYRYARLCTERNGTWNTGKEPYVCYHGFEMSCKIGYKKGINEFLDVLKYCYKQKENFPLLPFAVFPDRISRNNLRLLHQQRKELHGGTLDWYIPAFNKYIEMKMYNEAGIVTYWNALYYYDAENYTSALKHLEKSEVYLKISGNKTHLLKVFMYKSCIYYFQKKYNKAIEELIQFEKLNGELQDTTAMMYLLYNRGEVYFAMNEFNKAYSDFGSAIKFEKQHSDTNYNSKGYIKLAKTAFALKKFDRCIEILNLASRKAETMNDQIGVSEILYLHYLIYQKTGNATLALKSLEKFVALRDSIFTQEVVNFCKKREYYWINKLGRQITYQAHIDHERSSLYVQLKRNKLILWGASIFTLILGIIGILLYHANRNNKKANRYLKELDTTRNLFFSIIAHDLRGPLTATELYLKPLLHDTDKFRKEELVFSLKEIGMQTTNQKLLLDNLLFWAGLQKGSIKCNLQKVNLKEVATNNFALYLAIAKQKNITFEININEELYLVADSNMLSLILRNLIDNSIKYGGEDVIIKLEAHTNGSAITIKHSDSGKGFSKKAIDDFNNGASEPDSGKGHKFGLSLIRYFIRMQSGSIEINNLNQGVCISFTLPVFNEKL